MSKKNPAILHLILTYDWFDKIAAGEKTTEYRQCSEHWNNIFKNKKFDLVRFQRGFYKHPQNMIFEIKSINEFYGKNDLNLPKVWAIRLGEKVE